MTGLSSTEADLAPQQGQANGQIVDWRSLIEAAATETQPEPVLADTYYRRWPSAARPVELGCADGNRYVVKGLRNDAQQGRMIFTDQVAGRIGALMEAPVPQVTLVQVPAELIAANPDKNKQMGHMEPGIAHGSLRIPDVAERINSFDHVDDNRERFASLAIFFGWLVAGDRQFIYKNQSPRLVYSHDHGHFLPGGPNWTVKNLQKHTATAAAELSLVSQLNLTTKELAAACAPLNNVKSEQVASALAIPPDWTITLDERVALAEFLDKRRAELIATYSSS